MVLEPGPVIIVADLHLGLEAGLHKAGMHLPSQTGAKTRRLLKILTKVKAKRLVLLGDVKHTIWGSSYQEKDELPEFFAKVLSKVRNVDVVLGNHDGGLKELAPDGVTFHQHLVIDKVGLSHGHSWPSDEVMKCDYIILGHNHPTVIFIDELGQRNIYQCWIRSRLDLKAAEKRYKKMNSRATGIVMPAFDDLGRGTPFNLKGVKLLGPLLSNKVLNMENAEVHLLDGTYLGPLRDMEVTDRAVLEEQDGMPSGPVIQEGRDE